MSTYVCPHFDLGPPEREEMLSQLFSKVADARRHIPKMFEFTHRPMVLLEGPERRSKIDERSIFHRVHQRRKRNHVSVILGNTGTGKSELCAYLDLALRKQNEKVLYLEKSADLVRILVEDIPTFYLECTGKQFPQLKEMKKLGEQLRSYQTVAEFGALGLIMELRLNEAFDENQIAKDALLEFVRRKIERVIPGQSSAGIKVPDAADADIFEPSDLERRSNTPWSLIFRDKLGGGWEEVAAEMSRVFWNTIYTKVSAPDLTQIVRQLQRDTPQRRLYIIFEDYSFSRADTRKFLKFLEDDKDENKCEVVIAGLQGRVFDPSVITATARDRFDYYWTEDSAGNVPFLTRDSAFDFVLPFLAYPKWEDGSVRSTKGILDPAGPAKRSRCATCKRCPEIFRPAFPFTRSFVEKLYTGLPERRPRLLIDAILRGIEEYARNRIPVSSSGALARVKFTDYEEPIENQVAREFMAWYGERTVNGLVAPAFVADIMDIDTAAFEKRGDLFIYESGKKAPEKPTHPEDPLDKELNALGEWIPSWRKDPFDTTWKNTSDYILTGISRAVDKLTSGFLLKDKGALAIAFPKGQLPVTLEGEMTHLHQIVIVPSDLAVAQARAFLAYGFNLERRRVADFDQLMAVCGELLVNWVREWRTRLQSYVDQMSFEIRHLESGPVDLSYIALAGYCIALFLTDPWSVIDFAAIQFSFARRKPFAIHQDVFRQLTPENQVLLQTFVEASRPFHEWLGYHFGLDETTLNKPKLDSKIDLTTLVNLAADLQSKDIKQLGQGPVTVEGQTYSGPISLALGKESLREILGRVKTAAGLMFETPFAEQRPTFELKETRRFCEAYGTVEAPELANKIGELIRRPPLQGLSRDKLQSVHAIATAKMGYDRVRGSMERLKRYLESSSNEVAHGLAWYMWRLVSTNKEYETLVAFVDDLDRLSRGSEDLGTALEDLKRALDLFPM